MGIEYKIIVQLPQAYEVAQVSRRLPSPTKQSEQFDIYSFAVESDGFYFVDHLVDELIAAKALRVLIDEALSHSPQVTISEL